MARNDRDDRNTKRLQDDANADPITGTPGAHPVGVGVGAVGGGATGAAIGGVVGGPIGAGVGAVIGAVAGGLAGKGVAEAIDPTVEHEYWRGEYSKRPYATKGAKYEQYAPAYQYGWESFAGHREDPQSFDAIEPELRTGWERRRENEKMKWDDAKPATRDAWERLAKCQRDDCSDSSASRSRHG